MQFTIINLQLVEFMSQTSIISPLGVEHIIKRLVIYLFRFVLIKNCGNVVLDLSQLILKHLVLLL